MSEPPRLYCCVEHRDQKSSTMSLIDYLSKAYKEALTLLKTQLKIMKECKNNREDPRVLLQVPQDDTEKVEKMIITSKNLIEEFTKLMIDNAKQYEKSPANEIKIQSVILESGIDRCISPVGDNTELTIFNEEEILRSPVLRNRLSKSKKNVNLPVTIISDSTISGNNTIEKNELYASQTLLAKSDEKKLIKMNDASPMEGDNKHSYNVLNCTGNNDIIECTPVQKSYKRVGLSKLYNVDTSISHTGKKLRQSRLAFEPFKENVDTSIYRKSPVRRNICDKDNLLETVDQNQTNVDEIVENSPQRLPSFTTMKSRTKSHQEKNASRHKVVNLYNDNDDKSLESQCTDKENGPLMETNLPNFTQFLPALSSTQYDDSSASTRKSNNAPLKSSYMENSTTTEKRKHVSPTVCDKKELKDAKPSMYQSKRKLSESDSIIFSDETYFAPININKKDSVSTAQPSNYRHNEDNNHLQTLSSAKRSLFTSYDRPPPKINKQSTSFQKSKRTKEERAKLEGIDCADCEKYYNNCGLTAEQLKARLKACSRHRSKFGVRQSSPEGFWDEGFPDTQSSTLGN